MRFTTKTEYGIVCLILMAVRYRRGQMVTTIKDMVQSEGISMTYLEKIFQKLRRADIVFSHQGSQGGYQLSRPPQEIDLKCIVEALEGATFDVFCEPETRKNIVCTHASRCGLQPIWTQTKSLLDTYYGQISLEMITQRHIPKPLSHDGYPVSGQIHSDRMAPAGRTMPDSQ